MKKLILHIFIFFAIVFVVDFLFGCGCRYLNSHSKGGDTKSLYHIAKECNEDVIIFGSSRAVHHYVPDILSDSLGLSVFNGGKNGNGILFLYSCLNMIIERYTPKMIIYDISGYDIVKDDYSKYLGLQKRFYDDPKVSVYIDEIFPDEKLKLKSNLYRYNGSWIQLISDFVHPQQNASNGGYIPYCQTMMYEPELTLPSKPVEWDPLKKNIFERFCCLCRENDIELVVALSPFYKAQNSIEYQQVIQFCQSHNLNIIDSYSDTIVSNDMSNFMDSYHLNDKGARIYSSLFSQKIKRLNTKSNILFKQ